MRRRSASRFVLAAVAAFTALGAVVGEGAPRSHATVALPHALVVYSDNNDLWLYDAERDQVRRLTRDGPEPLDLQPRFRSRRAVSFSAGGALAELDLRSGRRRVVQRGPVLAFAWSSAGDALAYLAQPGGVGRHALYLAGMRAAGPRLLKRLPGPPRAGKGDDGRRTPDDEIALSWSPGGRLLLVVDTDLAPRAPTLYVFRRDGRELARVRAATHGGWLSDSRLYFRSLRTAGWSLLDVRSGATSRLSAATGRMHPALSPDGGTLALDDGRPWRPGTRRRGCSCTITLYDVAAGRERVLARGLVAPRWLSSRVLAATEVRPCVGAECGADLPMWVSRRRTVAIEVVTYVRTRLRMRSTLDADVVPARP